MNRYVLTLGLDLLNVLLQRNLFSARPLAHPLIGLRIEQVLVRHAASSEKPCFEDFRSDVQLFIVVPMIKRALVLGQVEQLMLGADS